MHPVFLALALAAQIVVPTNFPDAFFPEQPVSAPVFTSPAANQQTLAAASNGSIGFAVWLDQRSGHTDLYGSRIDANGVSLDPAGILIGTSVTDGTVIWNGNEFVVVSQSGSNDQFVFINTDGVIVDRKLTVLLYMQIAATMGSGPDARILFVGFGMATIVDSHANIVMANIRLAMPTSQSLAVAGAGANEFLILHTNLVPGRHLFADRLDRDGNFLGTVDTGVDLNVIGSTLALAGGDDDYLLVGRGPYEREVLAAHLDRNGVLKGFRSFVSYDASMRVPGNPSAKPAVLRDGDHYEVTWTTSEANGDAHAWRVTEPVSGSAQSNPVSIFDWTGMGYSTVITKIASQPVVITDALRSGVSTSIDPIVTVSGPSHPLLSSSATLQTQPQAAAWGNDYAVIWNEFGPDGSAHLYVRRFQPPASSPQVEVASNASGHEIKARIAAAGGVYVIAWASTDALTENPDYVVRRMSAATGEWLDDEPVPLATGAYELVLGASRNGVLAAYTIACSSPRCLRTRPIAIDEGAAVRVPEAVPTSSPAYQLSIASDGHDYLIAWNDNVCVFPCDVPIPSRLLAVRTGSDGRPLDTKPLVLDDVATFPHDPSIAWIGSSYAVVWNAGSQTSGRHVSASGVADAIRRVSIAHTPHLVAYGNHLLLFATEQAGSAVTTSGLAIDPPSLLAVGDPLLLAVTQPSAAALTNGIVLAYVRVDPNAGNALRVFTRTYGEGPRRRAARP